MGKVGSERPFFARWTREREKEVYITPKNKPWWGLEEGKCHVRPEKEEKITPPWGGQKLLSVPEFTENIVSTSGFTEKA